MIMKDQSIGILMATYNGENFIRDQIDSILNQTYNNWILVIHDDGSTDNTINIVKEYEKKYPNKILFIEDNIKCGGAKENFSHLIDLAKKNFNFDYIMFADQDDVWLPNKIEITLSKMLELEENFGNNVPIIVHTDLIVVDKDLNIIANSFWDYQKINPQNNNLNCLLLENTVTGCTMMINKCLLELLKTPFPREAIIHDWWIALVCVLHQGVIFPLREKTVLYRQHDKNDTGAKGADLKNLLIRLFENPIGFLNKRISLSRKIKNQAKALYYENQNKKIELLEEYIRIMNKTFKRKVFYIKNRMLCGNIIKKVGKLIFY